jgi:hypothetical protein
MPIHRQVPSLGRIALRGRGGTSAVIARSEAVEAIQLFLVL